MSIPTARCNVLIIGGGIAGLWIRNVLSRAGFSVVTLERDTLGSGQTGASQGILHAGFKYTVTEQAQRISDELQKNHQSWERALSGGDGTDLRSAEVLAETMYFWSVGLMARAAGAAAASLFRSGVRSLGRNEFPSCFAGSPAGVHVWEVQEKSVNPLSVVRALAAIPAGPLMGPATIDSIDMKSGTAHGRDSVGRKFGVTADHVVLAAGEGNRDLLRLGGTDPESIVQTRPLHQVLLRPAPFTLFGHCIQARPKPRLTVTTSTSMTGELVWYLGGDLAESGVERSAEDQLAFARNELLACLPWVEFPDLRCASFRINRAEGRLENGARPDTAVVRRSGKAFAVWPTKLAMAPGAAERVLAEIRGVGTLASPGDIAPLSGLSIAAIATPLCDSPALQWR